MTATLIRPPDARPPLSVPSRGRGFRRAKSVGATVLIVLSFAIILIPLVLVVGYVIMRGAAIVDLPFLTESIPLQARSDGPGMGPAVVGTFMITGAATLMAVPLGVFGGIYLAEYSGRSVFGRIVRFLAEVMTGVPSVVMGLFIYVIWVLNFGVSAFAGALSLGCLMLPVVIRTTEEMVRLVPSEQREASYALGSRKAGTIGRIVVPVALPGIVSGALLAIARAAGETAPLLFTILFTNETNTDLFHGPNTALSTQIYKNASSVFEPAQNRAWGAAYTLIVIVFAFTILARLVTYLFERRRRP